MPQHGCKILIGNGEPQNQDCPNQTLCKIVKMGAKSISVGFILHSTLLDVEKAMWSLKCLTIWIATSHPCCLSYHPRPNYWVAIHKQARKIISCISNFLHSSVNDKTQKNQRSPTHNNRLPSASICTKYSAQYYAIFSTIFSGLLRTIFCTHFDHFLVSCLFVF